MNTQIIPFYGLRRSGNHAILEWMIHSIGINYKREIWKDKRIIVRNNAGYYNECNTIKSQEELVNDINLMSKRGVNLILTAYEDTSLDYFRIPYHGEKIIIIRDILPLSASRIKRGKGDTKVDKEFVDKWVDYAQAFQEDEHLKIKFEDWLTSKKHRDDLLGRLGYDNLDKTDIITEFGNGSSFIGQKIDSIENLINRHNQIKFTPEVEKLLNQPIVLELRNKMGYI